MGFMDKCKDAAQQAQQAAKSAGARYKALTKTTGKARGKTIAANKKAAPYRKNIASSCSITWQA